MRRGIFCILGSLAIGPKRQPTRSFLSFSEARRPKGEFLNVTECSCRKLGLFLHLSSPPNGISHECLRLPLKPPVTYPPVLQREYLDPQTTL